MPLRIEVATLGETTMFRFTIAKFDGQSYESRFCPYELPENQLAEDMYDAREKAMFAFTDDGVDCEPTGEDCFVTEHGEEYTVFLSEIFDSEDD